MNKHIRIAFHFPKLSSGGVEKMRIILARELLSRDISVDFVLCEAKGEYLDQIPSGVRVIDLEAPRTRHSLRPLVRYLQREQPDVLISSLGPQNIIAIIAKKLAKSRTKVFVTQHNALTKQATVRATIQQRLVPLAYRYLLPLADGVIAVSKGIAKDIEKSTGYPSSRIHVIYNPAYTEHSKALGPPETKTGHPKNGRNILSIGRLVHQKGFDDLIKAFSIVHSNHPDSTLTILGNGPLEQELRDLSQKLGVDGSVLLPGFQSNPQSYIRQADLFVMSSRYEGFGNVIVEALSEGTPVVSTACDYGPDEILCDGVYGALVDVGNVEALATAMDSALLANHDPVTLKKRASDFSPRSIVDRYLTVVAKSQ